MPLFFDPMSLDWLPLLFLFIYLFIYLFIFLLFISLFYIFIFIFCLFAISWATPAAYGVFQARGRIGAVAAGLGLRHSNAGSETRQ